MKLRVFPAALAVAAVSLCVPVAAHAADQASTAHQDTEFVKTAQQGNYNEIDLAKVALDKSSDPSVKAFAQKMIDDHTKLMDSLKPYAMQAGLDTPTTADVSTLATKAKLELLSGKSFDKAYIKDMVEDHHHDLEAFMKEIKTTGYPELKATLEKGETVIRGHLEDIDGIAKKNGIAPAPIPKA